MSWSILLLGDLLSPLFRSFLPLPQYLLRPLTQFSAPTVLYCSVTGSVLLLTNGFKVGSKVYIAKAGVCEDAHVWMAAALGIQNLAFVDITTDEFPSVLNWERIYITHV